MSRGENGRARKRFPLPPEGTPCAYCGLIRIEHDKEAMCWDHVIPLCRGGVDEQRNLLLACYACNRTKRDRLPSEWRSDMMGWVLELEAQLLAEIDLRPRNIPVRRPRLVIDWLRKSADKFPNQRAAMLALASELDDVDLSLTFIST